MTNADYRMKLHTICNSDDRDALETLLLEPNGQLTQNELESAQSIALCEASTNGSEACVEVLLAHGVNPNSIPLDIGTGPVHNAATARIAEMLLDAGADPNMEDSSGDTPLCRAFFCEQPLEVMETLLGHGANPNVREFDEGRTSISFCATRACVEVFLKAGAEVMARSYFGQTPLHFLCRKGVAADAIEALISAGADVNAKDDFGETPLFQCQTGESVNLLLKHGCDTTIRKDDGQTALHVLSAQKDSLNENNSVEGNPFLALLESSVDVNARDSLGQTPLFCCLADYVPALVQKGATVNLQDANGKTALDVTDSMEKKGILMKFGAVTRFELKFGIGLRDNPRVQAYLEKKGMGLPRPEKKVGR